MECPKFGELDFSTEDYYNKIERFLSGSAARSIANAVHVCTVNRFLTELSVPRGSCGVTLQISR